MWAKFKTFGWKGKLGILAAILALLAAFGGLYKTGYNSGAEVSKTEIARYKNKSLALQKKLAAAQTQVDTKIVTEYKDRTAYVDRVVYKTKTVVQTSVPEQYNLSNGWVYAYNQSVAGEEVDPTKASDGKPSSTTDRTALLAIAGNNGICLANQAQLDSLQKWILETEKSRAQNSK